MRCRVNSAIKTDEIIISDFFDITRGGSKYLLGAL
jgi:hypothetical protein